MFRLRPKTLMILGFVSAILMFGFMNCTGFDSGRGGLDPTLKGNGEGYTGLQPTINGPGLLAPGKTATFEASNGVAPFEFKQNTGGGVLDVQGPAKAQYTADDVDTTPVEIVITDSIGRTITITIEIANVPFDSNGLRIINISQEGTNEFGKGLIATGSNLLQVGTASFYGHQNLTMLKYASDGTLDESFADSGIAIYDYRLNNEIPHAVALDGSSVYMAGQVYDTGDSEFLIYKTNTAGQTDFNFGNVTGPFVYDFGNGGHDVLTAVDTDSQGRIYAAGFINSSSPSQAQNSDVGVIRVTTAGQIDTSFGAGGKIFQTYGDHDRVRDLLVVGDAIYLAGDYDLTVGNSQCRRGYVLKLDSSGAVDGNFGNNGLAVISDVNGLCRMEFHSLHVDAGGNVYVGGGLMGSGAPPSNPDQAMVIKLTSTGALDAGFANSGVSLMAGHSGDHKIIDMEVSGNDFIAALHNTSNLGETSIARIALADGALAGNGNPVVQPDMVFSTPHSLVVSGNHAYISGGTELLGEKHFLWEVPLNSF